jgi:hypothetical protein
LKLQIGSIATAANSHDQLGGNREASDNNKNALERMVLPWWS